MPEAYPLCKCKHVFAKQALKIFAKLYPGMVGSQAHDLLFNGSSLSFRVLLYHYRLCSQSESAWTTAKNVFQGDTILLQPVDQILGMIEQEEEDEDETEEGEDESGPCLALVPVAPAASSSNNNDSIDWAALSESAPKASFWQVQMFAKFASASPQKEMLQN